MIRNPQQKVEGEGQSSPLYLLTGLAIGLIMGLILAWIVFPAEISGTSPAKLSVNHKEDYRSQIALAYAASGDAGRASARLGLLEDRDPIRELNVQAQLALLDQDSQREARALSQLSQAIYELVVARLAEEDSGGIQLEEDSPYEIIEQQRLCQNPDEAPTLKIFLLDSGGSPQEGMRLLLKSDSGEEESLSGSSSEGGSGFAQFDLFPSESYSLSVQEADVLEGVVAPVCAGEDGADYWGSWLMTLRAK